MISISILVTIVIAVRLRTAGIVLFFLRLAGRCATVARRQVIAPTRCETARSRGLSTRLLSSGSRIWIGTRVWIGWIGARAWVCCAGSTRPWSRVSRGCAPTSCPGTSPASASSPSCAGSASTSGLRDAYTGTHKSGDCYQSSEFDFHGLFRCGCFVVAVCLDAATEEG